MFIERLGYGEHHDYINQNILDSFISKLEVYRNNIKENYNKHTDNKETLTTLKETIEELLNNK